MQNVLMKVESNLKIYVNKLLVKRSSKFSTAAIRRSPQSSC